MKTLLTWIIVLAVLVGGIYWAVHKTANPVTPGTYTQTKDNANNPDYTPNPQSSAATTSTGVNVGVNITTTTSSAKTVAVTYTDSGFSPKTVSISVGDTVKFVNKSGKPMWVASASHPSHTVYDGTNLSAHCAAGATPSFDQCKSVAKGLSYIFTFTKAGTWAYHNHSISSDFGSVVVK